MSEPSYRKAIADYIRANANPPDKFSHQPRLYQLARNLAEDKPFDDDVLYAAVWMHDLGVFLPPCTVLQFMNVYIHDPLGYRFAAIGMATAPEL